MWKNSHYWKVCGILCGGQSGQLYGGYKEDGYQFEPTRHPQTCLCAASTKLRQRLRGNGVKNEADGIKEKSGCPVAVYAGALPAAGSLYICLDGSILSLSGTVWEG